MTINPDADPLDAYSQVVTAVARTLLPSVVALSTRLKGRRGDWQEGSGSAVVFSEDGFMITSAHVVEGSDRGGAAFVDGWETGFDVVGRDPLFSRPRRAPRTPSNTKEARRDGLPDQPEYDLVRAVL